MVPSYNCLTLPIDDEYQSHPGWGVASYSRYFSVYSAQVCLPDPLPVPVGVSFKRMAGGRSRRFHDGLTKWQLLRGLLLGANGLDVCGWCDELTLDGLNRRLRPGGESGTRGSMGEPYLWAAIIDMGDLDVGRDMK